MGRYLPVRFTLASVLAHGAFLWSVLAQATTYENKGTGSGLSLKLSYPQQCEVLNVTWTPEPDAFPYSVYIVAVRSRVTSFLITEDYEHDDKQITFQYVIPGATDDFYSFVVSVADSKGRGSTSDVLQVNFGEDPKSCLEYSQGQAFMHAAENSDGINNDRPMCGLVNYHLVQGEPDWFRPVPPYSVTLLPIGQTPITVDIPQSAVQGTYFEYSMPIPFEKGTQFVEFVSDSSEGGSGGASPVYMTSVGNDSYCLQQGYSLPNMNADYRLPLGKTLASFQNLTGAKDWPREKAAEAARRSRMIGGVIGGVTGVASFVLITTLYMVYSERAKSIREDERREGPQFVDLDEDDYHQSILRIRRKKREDNRQYYNIIPFLDGLGYHAPPQARECERSSDAVHGHSREMSSSSGQKMSYPNPSAFPAPADLVDRQGPMDVQYNYLSHFPAPEGNGRESSHAQEQPLENNLPSGMASSFEKANWACSSATPIQSGYSSNHKQQGEETESQRTSKTQSATRHSSTPPSITRRMPEELHEMYYMPGSTNHSTRSEHSDGNMGVFHSPIYASGAPAPEASRASQGGSRMVEMISMRGSIDTRYTPSILSEEAGTARLRDLREMGALSYVPEQ